MVHGDVSKFSLQGKAWIGGMPATERFVLGPACGGGHLDTNKAGTSAPAAQ